MPAELACHPQDVGNLLYHDTRKILGYHTRGVRLSVRQSSRPVVLVGETRVITAYYRSTAAAAVSTACYCCTTLDQTCTIWYQVVNFGISILIQILKGPYIHDQIGYRLHFSFPKLSNCMLWQPIQKRAPQNFAPVICDQKNLSLTW